LGGVSFEGTLSLGKPALRAGPETVITPPIIRARKIRDHGVAAETAYE
jgi:hypothetical protein